MYFNETVMYNKVGFVCHPFKKRWWSEDRYDEIHLIADPRASSETFRFECCGKGAFQHSSEYLETVKFLREYFNKIEQDG